MNMVHTTIETKDGWTRMVYHNTCVAEYRESRYLDPKDPRAGIFVLLNTGGHFTKTTKKRMNQFAEMFNLGFRVMQSEGAWIVSMNGTKYAPFEKEFNDNTCEFTVTE